MNAKLTTLMEAYAVGLCTAVRAQPAQYRLQDTDTAESYALRVALRVAGIITTLGLAAVHLTSPGFRNACSELRIEPTERGIRAYLGERNEDQF